MGEIFHFFIFLALKSKDVDPGDNPGAVFDFAFRVLFFFSIYVYEVLGVYFGIYIFSFFASFC